mgnify:CR=1 FL=1
MRFKVLSLLDITKTGAHKNKVQDNDKSEAQFANYMTFENCLQLRTNINIVTPPKLEKSDNKKTPNKIIEQSEKSLFDLAEKGGFATSLIKFDDALKMTIDMASSAYKNEEGIVGVPTGLRDLDCLLYTSDAADE